MAFTIADARRVTRKNARNAMSSGMYSDADVDDAWFLAAEEWTRVVKPNRVLTSLTLTVNSDTIPAFPSDCRPENVLQTSLYKAGSIIKPDLAFVDMNELRQRQWERGGSTLATGQPKYMAVPDNATGQSAAKLDVLADAPYSLEIWRWVPFTPWTAGQATDTTVIAGFTDEQARQLSATLAPSYLQRNEPENAERCKGLYQQAMLKMQQYRGAANKGGTESDHDATTDTPTYYYPRG